MMKTITTQGQRTNTQFSMDYFVQIFGICNFSDTRLIFKGDRLSKKLKEKFTRDTVRHGLTKIPQ